MHSIRIAAIIFAAAAGGAAVGMYLQRILPASHLDKDSKGVIHLGTGLIATMAALVLGMLVGGAKSSFDAERTGFQQLGLNAVVLDRTLHPLWPGDRVGSSETARLCAGIDRQPLASGRIAPGRQGRRKTRCHGKLRCLRRCTRSRLRTRRGAGCKARPIKPSAI